MTRTSARICIAVATSVVALGSGGLGSGCTAHRSSGPYSPQAGSDRQTSRADALCREAAAIALNNPEKAERLLREALGADLYHGPSHNNLGVLYLRQNKLYEAAGEFEWARKLMPGSPDPRVNLALTLERAGKVDEALATYTTALETQDGYLPAIQGLACLQLRSGKIDDRTAGLLDTIALRGDTDEWRGWARVQQLRFASPASQSH